MTLFRGVDFISSDKSVLIETKSGLRIRISAFSVDVSLEEDLCAFDSPRDFALLGDLVNGKAGVLGDFLSDREAKKVLVGLSEFAVGARKGSIAD